MHFIYHKQKKTRNNHRFVIEMWGTLETSMFEVKSLLRLRSTLTSSTKFAKSEILKFSRIRPSRAVSQLVNPNYFGASSKIIRLNQLAEVKKVVLVPPFL